MGGLVVGGWRNERRGGRGMKALMGVGGEGGGPEERDGEEMGSIRKGLQFYVKSNCKEKKGLYQRSISPRAVEIARTETARTEDDPDDDDLLEAQRSFLSPSFSSRPSASFLSLCFKSPSPT